MMPTTSMGVLDAAVAYVESGFAVVPVYGVTDDGRCRCGDASCPAKGKHPVGGGWQKRACRDVDAARDVFRSHEGNIGLYLGGTRFVLLDFDGEEGLRTRDGLLAEGILPPTKTARSGSGTGEHRLYRFTEWQSPEAVTDRKVGIKWDVKRNGQFLVSPSKHLSGGFYEWTDESEIAELPDALFERIRKPIVAAPTPSPRRLTLVSDGSTMLKRARAYVEKMPAAISGSGGHDATFAVARKLVQDFTLPETDAWDVLLEFNGRCEPPWSERDLRHKLDQAVSARVANPIEDRPKRSRHRNETPPSGVSLGDGGGGSGGDGGGGGDGGATPPPSMNNDWRQYLLWEKTRSGDRRLKLSIENVIVILQLHPAWKGLIAYDEFRGRLVLNGQAPWSDYHRPSTAETQWTDEDASRLEGWLSREFHEYAFSPTVAMIERAADVVARTHGFNPVRQYLEGVTWDQTFRLKNAATTYFGTPTSDYASKVFTWWMISAVARVFEPGCKADHVLILEGNQGLGKSTALEILASPAWFTDSPIDLNSKDAFERVRGRWIVELAELDSLFKADASRAKQFFSSRRDDYRAAYARREREQPRQCIFAGSVNLDVYLNDPTGARRFWPIVCNAMRHDLLRADRDQLWAEAVFMYREGAKWFPEASDFGVLTEEQTDRTVRDDWEDVVVRYLSAGRHEVTTADILGSALRLEIKDWTRPAQMRVGNLLRQAGWRRRKKRDLASGKTNWVYLKEVDRP